MSCDQEMCPNWTGDGDVCTCALFDLPRGDGHDPWTDEPRAFEELPLPGNGGSE